ncbi:MULTISPECIES: tetratricopeptide repeat protein [Burkholderiaceae]|uniref:tetratricopeptide repeat protein n=1 Tax=Burkholderiaceae TaxID=119060 RepID=UPI0009658C95|nr:MULTISPECIES: tetratricopeptide repeat protein [Burkholderiaceae]MCG1018710.1 tetratricopeptide repeat protein [Mycetohabitans sp. B4]SIT75198.1 Tetratricopeptide repeat-containing protein [Burkholderia sp. b13]
MKKLLAIILAGAAIAASAAAFAVPSTREVNNAIARGNWQQAHSQLVEVLRAHPNSAHAHYLYGQVLAQEGRVPDALAELQKARALDPELRFASSAAQFNAIEARVQQQAEHAVSRSRPLPSAPAILPGTAGTAVAPIAPPLQASRHSPSIGRWIGFVIVLALVVLLVRRTVLRARSNDDSRAKEQRRAQLKHATELLNATRSLKLDVRLSTVPGHEALLGEVDAIETALRELTDKLANHGSPVPDYALEDLKRRLDSARARTEGRAEPNAAAGNAGTGTGKSSSSGNPSVYAQEAERFGHAQGGAAPPTQPQPQPQPTVIVQHPGGGGSSMGGLLTGVLLGQMLGGSREQVIERDVIVDDERRCDHPGTQLDPGFDVGRGNDDWGDNTSGNIDVGDNDDSNWT